MSAPDAVPWRERLRGLPNMIGMALSLGLFAFGVLIATVPFDAAHDTGAGSAESAVPECGSPIFELVVPADDGQMARNVPTEPACRDEATSRVLLGLAAMGLGVVGGIATSQIRKRRYDPRRYDLIDARSR